MARKQNKNTNFLDTEDVIKELSERGNFTKSDVKVFLTCFEDLFSDCVEQGIDIDLRGFLHLYIQQLPEFEGVNASASRIQGFTVKQVFPPSKRAVVKLGINIRDLLREPSKKKIQNKKQLKIES